jgi:hypothetical protein
MIDAKWLSFTNPQAMIKALGRKASKRKRRLFGCACCRRIWDLIPDDRTRSAILVAERYADGLADEEEFVIARLAAKSAQEQFIEAVTETSYEDEECHALGACFRVVMKNAGDVVVASWDAALAKQAHQQTLRRNAGKSTSPDTSDTFDAWDAELAVQCALVRDIFGSLLVSSRPIIDPAWVTWQDETIRRLAQAIYQERNFAGLPILADALEEAGCDNADILAHCRNGGEHARGCWVVDLIIGKA